MKVRCIRAGADVAYLTAGKIYEAYDINEMSFLVHDNDGDELYCLWESCFHAEWERLESTEVTESNT
jgi:hypothetical protein